MDNSCENFTRDHFRRLSAEDDEMFLKPGSQNLVCIYVIHPISSLRHLCFNQTSLFSSLYSSTWLNGIVVVTRLHHATLREKTP